MYVNDHWVICPMNPTLLFTTKIILKKLTAFLYVSHSCAEMHENANEFFENDYLIILFLASTFNYFNEHVFNTPLNAMFLFVVYLFTFCAGVIALIPLQGYAVTKILLYTR